MLPGYRDLIPDAIPVDSRVDVVYIILLYRYINKNYDMIYDVFFGDTTRIELDSHTQLKYLRTILHTISKHENYNYDIEINYPFECSLDFFIDRVLVFNAVSYAHYLSSDYQCEQTLNYIELLMDIDREKMDRIYKEGIEVYHEVLFKEYKRKL